VRSRQEALAERFDVAVATWWETVFTLFELSAHRYAYFVQSLEDRFYDHDHAERLGAALTLDLPVAFITEARWIADTLAAWRPDASCYLVRNGIDKQLFAPLMRVRPSIDRPLRIVVEGSPWVWHKGVPDALDATRVMQEPHRVTVVCGDPSAHRDIHHADQVLGPLSHREMADLYAENDVVLKLSRVEGMFGPPLEGFHRGTTCVVTPVTGHEEYVEHGHNGLVTDWDDLRGTARQLDLLARDRRLLHFLRTNALETARAWPDWGQASQFMAAALLDIVRQPPPAAASASAHLAADLRSGIEVYHRHLVEREAFARRALRFERRIARVRGIRIVRWGSRLRHSRPGQLTAKVFRPVTERLRRALS
jgi:glycosyltransferase involved in cell wall biosynthesis